MKLAIMKLICLLVLLGGVYMLGLALDVSYVKQVHGDYVLNYWPLKTADGMMNMKTSGIALGILFVVLGLYGFLPKLPSRKGKTITYQDGNNEITLELKPIRKKLLKIMRRMPEVYSIDIDLKPERKGKRVLIDARVVLQNCAALGARQCLMVVKECIYTTAHGLLGLEDCQVTMSLKGVHVDAAAIGKQVREQLEMKQQEASAPKPEVTEASDEEPKKDTTETAQPEAKEEKAEPENKTEAANVEAQAEAAAEQDAPADDPEVGETESQEGPQEEEETVMEEAESQEEQEDASDTEPETGEADTQSSTPESEEQPVELPVVEAGHHEETEPEMSDTLHGIDLPPLAEEDMDLPPGPKINSDGEITTDEAADADIASGHSGSDEKTPDAVEVDILSPVPWKKNEEMPEPVPDELSGDPEDVDVDPDEYHNT